MGGLITFADAMAPDLMRHPAAPTVASGLVLIALGVLKIVDRTWFQRNDSKTDNVGSSVIRVHERLDRVVDKLELLGDAVNKLHGLHEEQRALAERHGRLQLRLEKAERDLHVLHDWRRKGEGKGE